MTNEQFLSPTVTAWCIQHHRGGRYLGYAGKDATVRTFPMFFAEEGHAAGCVDAAKLQGWFVPEDWKIRECAVTFRSR